ncbi:hypothetical protein PR048_030460 [Dryococelus australis]|uniref:Uncharacterized protein n=1 Tax=Dryococelus australis TaxID=614101 RepID=A0ABQ9GCW7_9NEOP|nr:hypothetical protein PR048_030460 [Dryococelus australis]
MELVHIRARCCRCIAAEWAAMRREAWSGEHKGDQWHFNRRNQPHREAAAAGAGVLNNRRGDHDLDVTAAAAATTRGPAVVYSRELQQLQQRYDQQRRDILDMRHRTRDPDVDTDSMRQHEVERGSDLGRGVDGHPQYRIVLQRTTRDSPEEKLEVVDGREISPESRREQFYIREGNAEILRLVTRGRSVEENQHSTQQDQRPTTNVPPARQHGTREERGKEILMQRFIEDQRKGASGSQQPREARESQETTEDEALNARQQELLVRRLLEEEEARLGNMRLLNEALLHHRGTMFLVPSGDHETQSLPGQTSMATQTDVDNSTQTDPLCLMRPPRRRAKSDNDESYTDEDDQQTKVTNGRIVNDTDNGWPKRRKIKKRRQLRYRGDIKLKRGVSTKRHKIKTPIMEETESAVEAIEQSSNSKSKESSDSMEVYSQNKESLLPKNNNASKVQTTAGEVEVIEVNKEKMVTVRKDNSPNREPTPSDSLEKNYHRVDAEGTDTLKLLGNENLSSAIQNRHNPEVSESSPKSSKKEEASSYFTSHEVISEAHYVHLDNKQLPTAQNETLLREPQPNVNQQHESQSKGNKHLPSSRLADDNFHVLRNNISNDHRYHGDEYRRPSSHDIDMKYDAAHYYQEDNRRSYSRERTQEAQEHERRPRSRSRRTPADVLWYENYGSPNIDRYGRIRPHSIDNRYRSSRWNEEYYADARRHYETDKEDWLRTNSFDHDRSHGRYRNNPYETMHHYRRYNSRSHSRERRLRDRRRSHSRERDYYEWLYHRSRSRNRIERKRSQRSRSRYREDSARPNLSRHRISPSRRELEDNVEWYYGTDDQFPHYLKNEDPKVLVVDKAPENIQSKEDFEAEIIKRHVLSKDKVSKLNEQASKNASPFRIAEERTDLKQAEEPVTVHENVVKNLAITEEIHGNEAEHAPTEKSPNNLASQLGGIEHKISVVESVSTQVSPQRTLPVEKQSMVRYSDRDNESLKLVDSLEQSDEEKSADKTKTKVQISVKMVSQATGSPIKDRSRQKFASGFGKEEKQQSRQSTSEPGRSDKDTQQAAGKAKSAIQVSPRVEEQKKVGLPVRKGSRYMEWYKTKKEERDKKRREEEENKKKDEKKNDKLQRSRRNFVTSGKAQAKEDIPVTPERKKEDIKEDEEVEAVRNEGEDVVEEKLGGLQTLKVSGGFEDDLDSGIAMSSLPLGSLGRRKKHHQLMEKKSIFTIAYDDMQTQQIRADSTSPPY